MTGMIPVNPGPSNAPAPIRSFGWFVRRLQRWLGVSDQQHDFDALAYTLSVKDRVTEAQILSLIEQLKQTKSVVGELTARLAWYEQRVPRLAREKRAYDEAANHRHGHGVLS